MTREKRKSLLSSRRCTACARTNARPCARNTGATVGLQSSAQASVGTVCLVARRRPASLPGGATRTLPLASSNLAPPASPCALANRCPGLGRAYGAGTSRWRRVAKLVADAPAPRRLGLRVHSRPVAKECLRFGQGDWDKPRATSGRFRFVGRSRRYFQPAHEDFRQHGRLLYIRVQTQRQHAIAP